MDQNTVPKNGRILCIDYGAKRTGLATTDPLQIIATALDVVETQNLFPYLKNYFANEGFVCILIGYPLNLDGTPTHATPLVIKAISRLEKEFPNIPIKKLDERFSSKMAVREMVDMGMKKKDRQIKGNIDKIAATMLLQEYLQNPH